MANSTNGSSTLSLITLWRAKEWITPTQVLKSLYIQTGTGDLHLIKPFSPGERQARQFFRRISTEKRVFLLFFSDLSVGTNTPSRISATGYTVLVALGVRFMTSPEDLSTSSNSFFMSRLSLSREPPKE